MFDITILLFFVCEKAVFKKKKVLYSRIHTEFGQNTPEKKQLEYLNLQLHKTILKSQYSIIKKSVKLIKWKSDTCLLRVMQCASLLNTGLSSL